jgi:hypothetical protein
MLLNLEEEKKRTPSPTLTIASFFLLNLAAFLFCGFSILFLIMPTRNRSQVQEPREMTLRLDRANVMDKKNCWSGLIL